MVMNTAGKTIFLACELGGGMGHIDPLLRMAHGLAELGHRPILAVRNLALAWPKVSETPFPLLQAPVFFWSTQRIEGEASFSEMLAQTGFQSEATLLALVKAWDHLLELLRPDLVIADYSPALCLATYRNIPTLNVGFGFIVPPTDGPHFPPLLAGSTPSFDGEELLLANVHAVQRQRNRPAPPSFPATFADAEPFLTVLPMLDHYAHVRGPDSGHHLGPMVPLLGPQEWPTSPRFFAYLKANNPATPIILNALAQAGHQGEAFILGADARYRAELAKPGIDIYEKPVALNDVLPRVRVVLHHGGINMAQQALAAGRPQLIFPEHLEATLTAARLHQLGVAHYMKNQFPAGTIQAGIRQLLFEERYRTRANELAHAIHQKGPWDPLPKILRRCQEILTKSKGES
jgi:hypothetical protein